MKKKLLKKYFNTQINVEDIPSFETIHPFLKKEQYGEPEERKTSLAFYTVFSTLVVLVLTTGFIAPSSFPGHVAAEYKKNSFGPFAKAKFIKAEQYLQEIRNIKGSN